MNRLITDIFCPAFRALPDPGWLYLSSGHSQALTVLEYGIEANNAISVLTGEPGTGKTMLLRAIAAKYRDDYQIGRIGQNGADLIEPLRWVLHSFGQKAPDAPVIELLGRMRDFLETSQRPALLIADEAQSLSDAALDQLRQLTDLHRQDRVLMPLLLVGGTALRDRLAQPQNRALASRVGGRFHLPPLAPAESAAYLAHRLNVAQSRGHGDLPSFDAEAAALLHDRSGGVPRLLNHLAQRCLYEAALAGLPRIGAGFAQDCLGEAPPSAMEPPQVPAPEPAAPRPDPVPQPVPLQIATPAARPAPAARPTPTPDAQTPPRRRRTAMIVPAALLAAAAALGVVMLKPAAEDSAPQQAAGPDPEIRAAGLFVPPPRRPAAATEGPRLPPVAAISAQPDPAAMIEAALTAEVTDPQQAALLYARAALWGNARAAYYLGQFYETGMGVQPDPLRARGWYTAAQDVGGAADRLAALAQVQPNSVGNLPPRPVAQSVYADGRTEIHWRAGMGESPAAFAVDYVPAGGDGTVQRHVTDLSAALLPGPVLRWRVVTLDAQGRDAAASGWSVPAPGGR